MTLARRRLLSLAGGAVAAPILARSAWSQAYPTRPVRMIVPLAAGGPTDVFARLIAQKLSDSTGKQFYVENIPGAGGNIGMGRAAQAAPDGYRILVVASSYVVNPSLYSTIPYDPYKDFDPITIAVANVVALSVNPSLPARTVDELIAFRSRQVRLRVRGGRPGQPSRGRNVPPDARSRPRARPLQRLGTGDRLDGRGPHPDRLHQRGNGGAAGQGRPAARAGGDERDADGGAAGGPPCGHRVRRLARAAGPGRNAQGDHHAPSSRGRRHHRAADHEGAAGGARLSTDRKYARGVCGSNPHRHRQAGKTHSRGGHRGAVSSGAFCEMTQRTLLRGNPRERQIRCAPSPACGGGVGRG